MIKRDLMNEIEALVDTNGLASVLEQLAEVCLGKKMHLESNWQDEASGKPWGEMFAILDRAERTAIKRGF